MIRPRARPAWIGRASALALGAILPVQGCQPKPEPKTVIVPVRTDELHAKAAAEFDRGVLYKPRNPESLGLAGELAPLIVEQWNAGQSQNALEHNPSANTAGFGAVVATADKPVVDAAHPAVYWATSSAELRGSTHQQVAYAWFYPETESSGVSGRAFA